MSVDWLKDGGFECVICADTIRIKFESAKGRRAERTRASGFPLSTLKYDGLIDISHRQYSIFTLGSHKVGTHSSTIADNQLNFHVNTKVGGSLTIGD